MISSLLPFSSLQATILRWDNGQVIPGTQGITPGPGVNLSNWNTDSHNLQYGDFSASLNLSGANFSSSWLDNADFQNANLANATFASLDLIYNVWRGSSLINANLSRANLGKAFLRNTNVTNADLNNANVKGADLAAVVGLTTTQIYSTASYRAKDLQGINLGGIDLASWDFSGQDLRKAAFNVFNLANSQYVGSNLSRANLTGANLSQAILGSTSLSNAILSGANLDRADLTFANLFGANLNGASLSSVSFFGVSREDGTIRGANLTKATLREANLSSASLGYSNLTSADLSGANLIDAFLTQSTFKNALLNGADTRGAQGLNLSGATARNAILPDGAIVGLDLNLGDKLVVRDDDGLSNSPSGVTPRNPIPVNVQNHMTMSDGGVLQLRFESDPWDSLISFQAGIPVALEGTLELTFAPEVDLTTQVGRVMHVFNWNGVMPTAEFHVASPYAWDLSQLYTSGNVSLLSVTVGDMNGDGSIDAADASLMFDNWENRGQGDLNLDGIVDAADAQRMFESWTGDHSASAIPEPNTALLGMIGALWLVKAWRSQ